MNRSSHSGFTLVEMAVTLLILGLVLTFAIPGFQKMNQTFQLQGATQNVAAQIRLAREKALATGIPQPVHFVTSTQYHIHYPSGISTQWTLPTGVTFTSGMVGGWYTMQRDGRCTYTAPAAGLIVLQNRRGNRDTVSVQLSGLVQE